MKTPDIITFLTRPLFLKAFENLFLHFKAKPCHNDKAFQYIQAQLDTQVFGHHHNEFEVRQSR